MKGIILAGGSGTRLYPITMVTSKQLLPVYDKPMVFYPLSTLMLAGIRDILIISTPTDLPNYKKLFGDGSNYGVRLSYKEQPSPDGLAQAFILGREFIGDDTCAMILGDNIFYGNGLEELLKKAASRTEGATIFGYYVEDPERFGVAGFDENGRVVSLVEKEYASSLKPSARGELEITDLNRIYLEKGSLNVELLGRGYAWLDTGTVDSLLEASSYVSVIENRQGTKIAALEEIAYNNGWIDVETLKEAARKYGKSPYGKHLMNVAEGKIRN